MKKYFQSYNVKHKKSGAEFTAYLYYTDDNHKPMAELYEGTSLVKRVKINTLRSSYNRIEGGENEVSGYANPPQELVEKHKRGLELREMRGAR